MEFRTFRKPEPKPENDGRTKTFGKRQGFMEATVERLSTSKMLKALALGLGVGALAALFGPSVSELLIG